MALIFFQEKKRPQVEPRRRFSCGRREGGTCLREPHLFCVVDYALSGEISTHTHNGGAYGSLVKR